MIYLNLVFIIASTAFLSCLILTDDDRDELVDIGIILSALSLVLNTASIAEFIYKHLN